MTRNLKALGLALVAVFALSAMAASTASAKTEGTFKADGYPAHIDGEATTPSHFKGLGGSVNVTCLVEEYTGTLAAEAHSIEVTPTYKGCTNNGARGVTVTHNECTYKFYNANDTDAEGETTEDEWRVTTGLVCPETKKVEVHIYNELSHASGTWCTLTMSPAANTELEGLTVEDTTTATPTDLTVSGSLTIKSETHGVCSAGLTIKLNSTLEVTNVTVQGTDGCGFTAIEVS